MARIRQTSQRRCCAERQALCRHSPKADPGPPKTAGPHLRNLHCSRKAVRLLPYASAYPQRRSAPRPAQSPNPHRPPTGARGFGHPRLSYASRRPKLFRRAAGPLSNLQIELAAARLGPLIRPALRQSVRLQTGGSSSIRQPRHHLCANPDRRYTRTGEQRNSRSV